MSLSIFAMAMNGQDAPSHDGEIALQEGFQNPPNSAKPRVWWHWLNANITKEGIRKDLEWLQSVGIGGLQNFDVNFSVPTVVDKPVVYMTDEWKELYRYSVSLADQLGLEFGIAASPGWSETGGPWVKPEDGMKKLVWSETRVAGGRPFEGQLALPPSGTGAFQDLDPAKEYNPNPKHADPQFYADIAVLAFPAPTTAVLPLPRYSLEGGESLNSDILSDGKYREGIDLPKPSETAPVVIGIQFPSPQVIRSATVFLPEVADIYSGAKVSAVLERHLQGEQWEFVSDIALSTVPSTVSFGAVTAERFRVRLASIPETRSNSGRSAAGFDTAYLEAIAAMMTKSTVALHELRFSSEAKVHQFEAKAGFSVARDYYALETANEEGSVDADEVINLTDRLQSDGRLDWTPPEGQWQVVRLGYSLLGKTNHPAIAEATGLEVDKLDSRAVRDYLETYLQNYRDAVGEELLGKRGISALLTDSTEVGAFNWTPQLLDHFQRLRGYDATPWLPVLTGVIIGSREQSDKFLYDFRRTLGDLHATEHYGTVAKVAHEQGLKVYGESLEGWRPSLGDDMELRRFADYPMAALWAYEHDEGPKSLYLADMRGASSIAHLYGQKLAAAESMTSTRQPWNHVPADLRHVVDLEFLQGINRIVIHSSVHQPLDDKQPGLSIRHIGQFFNRHDTWAGMARPWLDYIARSSYLLQQGRFVADVAYFYGEEMPLGAQTWDAYFDDLPKRYGYDFVNPAAVMELLRVDAGHLVSEGGARYQVLYLGGTSERMTLALLQRIAALVEEGATVVGNAPEGSPSLMDDREAYQALVAKLWSGKPITSVGNGRVIAGNDVEAALQRIGVIPDVALINSEPKTDIPFVHRTMASGDIYFLSNRNKRSEQVDMRFRVTGKAPQIWRADTGEMIPVSYRMEGDDTIIPLTFAGLESFFVVFLADTQISEQQISVPQWQTMKTLDGPWEVTFQQGRGAPPTTSLPALIPLNEHRLDGIKYFSGVATYSKNFSLPAEILPGEPLMLDLGNVGDLAEIWLNGRQVGTVWHPPFQLNIGDAVTVGDNRLEILVANRWVNRLIGDAQPDSEKIAYTVMPTYRADAPLRPAGLIGPVTLQRVKKLASD